MKGTIFDIQRLSVHDGPGIRTIVFMKGCPLSCIWCHNPESRDFRPTLGYSAERCIGCGRCATACSAHSFDGGVHRIDRTACEGSGACVGVCPTGALTLYGKEVTAAEVMEEVMRDRAFYKTSGGGLTVSGGEPLGQPDFLCELLTLAKQSGLHTCLETCGYTSRAVIERVAPSVDLFLYDFKESDPALHEKFTGVSSERIISNLRYINSLGKRIVLRCPIIPGLNDRREHLVAIADLAASLDMVEEVDIMAYHLLGTGKYRELGMECVTADIPAMTSEQKRECIEYVSARLRELTDRRITVK